MMGAVGDTAKGHPVAATTATSSGLAVFVVWLLGKLGLNLNAEQGVIIAGLLATVIALVGREGIMGVWSRVLRGSRE